MKETTNEEDDPDSLHLDDDHKPVDHKVEAIETLQDNVKVSEEPKSPRQPVVGPTLSKARVRMNTLGISNYHALTARSILLANPIFIFVTGF